VGPNPQIDQGSNRIAAGQGYLYDSAGNLTDEPGKNYRYDGENLLINLNNGQARYGYDGEGRRVRKEVSGAVTVFVYDAMGKLVAEYTSTTPVGGTTSYLSADYLRSPRIIADGLGGVKARHDYLVFGEELTTEYGGRTAGQGYVADTVTQKFTSYERDSESGLDYAQARYYSSAQGRFTSADETLIGSYKSDPQSWNLFSYARNNPLLYRDLTGRDYNIYDKDGNYMRRISDAELSNLILDSIASTSEDGRTIKFKDGSTGYFEDAPTGDATDIQRHVGWFEFTGEEITLAQNVAYTVDDDGVLPDPRFDPWRFPWTPATPIHYSELNFGEEGIPEVAMFCGGVIPCYPRIVGSRRAPLSESYVKGSNVRTTIGGREFSGHALDRMQQYGMVPSAVENAIANGIESAGATRGTTKFYDPINKIDVIINSRNGRVVTTGPR
jgi:RHS repeat-associated protein